MNITEGIKLFNDSFYFEAHDWFEDLWMESVGDSKNFLQGLIQISVGMYHLENENINGALSQYSKALKKLDKYPDNYEKINLLQLKKDINYIIKQITLFYSKKNFNFRVEKLPFIELNA